MKEHSIIWWGSPNYWDGYEDRLIIVDHIMAGTINATNGWFRNRRSEASTHFGIAKDGRIYQYVDLYDTAWGNGIFNKPNMANPIIRKLVNEKKNPNKYSISIEHEGQSGQPFTEAMYQASLWLHHYIIKQFPKIKPDKEHILGHKDFDTVNRLFCPGSGFNYDRLISDLNKEFNKEVDEWNSDTTETIYDNGFYVEKRFARWFYDNNGWVVLGHPLEGMSGEGYNDEWVWRQDFENGSLIVKAGGSGEITYIPVEKLYQDYQKGE